MRLFIIVLLGLTFLSTIRVFVYSRMLCEGRIDILPSNIKSIETFNDCSLFIRDKKVRSRFLFVNDDKRAEAYLRFSIPNLNPAAYKVVIRIKARADLLREGRIRTAKSCYDGGTVVGDVATYEISMANASDFMWTDNKCYVGVWFPKSALKQGDVVELLDFKFSLR